MGKALSKTDETKLKRVIVFYAFLFVTWGFYRFLFQFPEEVEELIIKPLVWLGPIVLISKKEKLKLSDLGFRGDNFFAVVYFMLTLGFLFSIAALSVNFLKYERLNFGARLGEGVFLTSLTLSFVTAFSEEIAFRGYIFGRTLKYLKNEWLANFLTSAGWVLIHLPVAVFNWKLATGDILLFLILISTFSVGATFVYARTKNIAGPILLHVLWQWPIILFR